MTWLTVILAAALFTLALVALAVGVLLGRKPIKGSCGGLSAGGACELCSGDPADCPNKTENPNQQPKP